MCLPQERSGPKLALNQSVCTGGEIFVDVLARASGKALARLSMCKYRHRKEKYALHGRDRTVIYYHNDVLPLWHYSRPVNSLVVKIKKRYNK